jgi:mannose-6-phosphate isomerase-like protein (cupin superfamily)
MPKNDTTIPQPLQRDHAAQPARSAIRILLPNTVMQDGLSMFEDRNEPGAGPPLHVHHDAEEVFQVLDGDYQSQCGEEAIEAGCGG